MKNQKQNSVCEGLSPLVYLPEILPVHNGNNYWHSLIFKDNGVGSPSSLITPYAAKTVQFPGTAGCHRPSDLPASRIRYPQGRRRAVGGGWREDKKGHLHLMTRDRQRQKRQQQQQKGLLLWCFSFHNILHQRWLHFKSGGKGAGSCV